MDTFDLPVFFRDVLRLPDEALIQRGLEIAAVRTVKKDEYVVKQGEVAADVIFLIDGAFRGCFSNAAGKEITDCFVFKPGCTVMGTQDIKKPSPMDLKAIVPSRVLCVPIHEMTSRLWRYRSLQKLYYRLLLWSSTMHWELKNAVRQYDAMGRYQWFCENYSGLVDIVKDKDIASFLDMSPVTLSRVRRAIKEGDVQNE